MRCTILEGAMKFTGRASSSLRECWLIGFDVNPRSKQNFGYAFYAFRQRALQELNALRKLLGIAVGRLPCFVEYADQSWHTGCLSAQTTRRVV